MGPAVVSYRFQRMPAASRYFPRALFGRRSALVPDGQTVPRLEASVANVRASRRHLDRYREVCGFTDDGLLPIAYPHVVAMPLQYAILTHPRFVVRIMGLIHVANEIRQARPLSADRPFSLRTWIEGHRAVDRGHEFDLYTSVEDAEGTAWQERSTLLARRPSSGKPAARSARQALRYEKPGASRCRAGGNRRPARGRAALRLALGRPKSDSPRGSWRTHVRVRPRGGPRHVVDGAHARGARAWSACAAGAGTRGVQVPALHALGREARALGARISARLRAERCR